MVVFSFLSRCDSQAAPSCRAGTLDTSDRHSSYSPNTSTASNLSSVVNKEDLG